MSEPMLKPVAGSSALIGEVGRDQEKMANARNVKFPYNVDKQWENGREFRVRDNWPQISRESP